MRTKEKRMCSKKVGEVMGKTGGGYEQNQKSTLNVTGQNMDVLHYVCTVKKKKMLIWS